MEGALYGSDAPKTFAAITEAETAAESTEETETSPSTEAEPEAAAA
jgi:hypothetical protein